MVLRTKPSTSQKISWRSRLVWSRARDWKSRNRQKRFKSSNLFFSANKDLKQFCFRFFILLAEKKRFLSRTVMCDTLSLTCRTLESSRLTRRYKSKLSRLLLRCFAPTNLFFYAKTKACNKQACYFKDEIRTCISNKLQCTL